MIIILSKFMGASDHFPLSYPLLQVVHLTFKLGQAQPLLQPPVTLLSQVFQAGVQLVHLGLTQGDSLTVSQKRNKTWNLLSNNAQFCQEELPFTSLGVHR